VRLKFSDLFEDKAGTPGYSARCEALHGEEVEIPGYVADSHDGSVQLLVAEPGGCPHCSQVPAIALPGLRIKTGEAVTLRGTLSYGFKMDTAGNASMLRLENARVATGLPS
jgi:hypothetical protein